MESTASSTIYKIDEIDFTIFIDNLWNIDKYYQVYVSIGGKWNQSRITFTNPHNSLPINVPSNACHQMIPRFLQNLQYIDKDTNQTHILVIVIDQFTNPETVQKNSDIISREFSYSEVFYDVVLLNSRINIQKNKLSIEPILNKIVGLANTHSIPAKRFMICNYIMFHHPNESEYRLEEHIPIYIQRILGKNSHLENIRGPYCDRLYQWYGPNFHFYQLIFKYSEYYTQRMVYHGELTNIWKYCENAPYSLPICQDTAHLLIDEVKHLSSGSPRRLENAMSKLKTFFKTHLDISSTNKDCLISLTYRDIDSDDDYVDVRLAPPRESNFAAIS